MTASRFTAVKERIDRFVGTVIRAIEWLYLRTFGDDVGAAIFLGAVLFFGLQWRIGFFITDNWTIANTLVSVADGHLYVDRVPFGLAEGNTPGMHYVDGRLYGRNYGHVLLALPFLWALEVAAVIGDPRIVLAAGWSLGILGFAVLIARIVGREYVTVVGAGVAIALFAINVGVATPLDARWFPVIALQLTTMMAAGLIGVLLYRAVAALHGRSTGAYVGCVIVLSSPIAFWATIPKRHVLTALLAVIAFFGLVASRRATGPGTGYRALGYAAIGATTWVHAAEGLVLFAVFVPLDLATGAARDRRTLALLGAVLLLSLLPFAATNAAIAGNPLEPPRVVTTYSGQEPVHLESAPPGADGMDHADGGTGSASVDEADGDGSSSGGGYLGSGDQSRSPLAALAGAIVTTARRIVGVAAVLATLSGRGLVSVPVQLDTFERFVTRGVGIVLDDPSRMYRTFIRSGWLTQSQRFGEDAINLTMVESLPILGAIVALPVAFRRSIRRRTTGLTYPGPARLGDVFVGGYVVVFVLLYINRLPLNAQVTVRYLLPIVPFLVYAVSRVPQVRRVVDAEWRTLGWTYGALVLIGTQLLFVLVRSLDLTAGEAMQLHGILGIAVAAIVGVWAVIDGVTGLDPRIGAIVLAIAGATGTWFLLGTGLDYFVYGDYALAIPRLVSDAVSIV